MGMRTRLIIAIILSTSWSSPVWGATRAQLKKYVSEAMVYIVWDNPNGKRVQGSGVVFRLPRHSGKYVLTSHHVIEDAIAGKIPIRLQSFGMPEGKGQVTDLAGWHVFHDLASYRLPEEMKEIRPLKLSQTFLKVNQKIGIYSFPMGAPWESFGVVKGMRVKIYATPVGPQIIKKYEFTNFVISGSSGGMMVNRDAELVGIVTHSKSPEAIRIGNFGGLGTPSPIILKLVDEAIKNGWRPKNN